MGENSIISHLATVIEADNKHITLKLDAKPGCVGCKASGVCDVSSGDDHISIPYRSGVEPGSRVELFISQKAGFSALFLGYLLPLIILVSTLIASLSSGLGEGVAGLLSLSATAAYYGIIYFFRDRIGKKFTFDIKAE